jgi:phage shock protein E
MINFIKSIFGMGQTIDYKNEIANGAVIVDVRTKSEFAGGHIKGSMNIPLDMLQDNINKIAKNKTIITCCASGMRSSAAKSLLKKKGFDNVHNGGGWYSLQQKIQ